MQPEGDSLVNVLLAAVEGEGDAAAARHYRNHLPRPTYTLKALHGDELEQTKHVLSLKNHQLRGNFIFILLVQLSVQKYKI